MVCAVIFDCFGVLTTDVWRAFLDNLPPSANIERARELNRAVDAGLISQDEFFAQVEEVTGQRPPQIEQKYGGEVVKNTALLRYIAELRQRGYAIGMISNISSNWIRDELLTPQEQGLFDVMLFSHEIGMTKPDPRIYMLACERLRVAPHEAVMVDDIDSYVAAAVQEGLQGVVYADFDTAKSQLELLLGSQDETPTTT